MKLLLKSPDMQGVALVEVEGHVNPDDVLLPEAKNPLEFLLGPQWRARRIAVSLARVPQIGSTGIAWLVTSHSGCKKGGGIFVMHSLSAFVKDEVQILALPKIMHIATNEFDARALALREKP